jgi:hypothetical protein
LKSTEVVDDEEDIGEEQDWLSDAELVRRAAQTPGGEKLTNRDRNTFQKFKPATEVAGLNSDNNMGDFGNGDPAVKSIHKQERDELIRNMHQEGGGSSGIGQREEGFVVDSVLMDIAHDYSIPVCYLGDVLVQWGVPPPIDPRNTPLKDLVTGEQAFSLLEALVSLDSTRLNERYSSDTLEDLCYEYDDMFDLAEAVDFCMKEGYNLPFGIQTCLKTEQEEQLLRVLASDMD